MQTLRGKVLIGWMGEPALAQGTLELGMEGKAESPEAQSGVSSRTVHSGASARLGEGWRAGRAGCEIRVGTGDKLRDAGQDPVLEG